ncbi:tyrosyl-tRNA synthetase [Candidatus Blochmanniella floridana]|uniref:Tyrosine--tRNA ligase n=1 Tax=Blochmanniella floridana TaxID=203907 RepID=SYY_BLOFL|nr:RecName: Full=Tyrosine--tRNA ligase; AltName: Full=Tyrosyl-tRNA synthetase; Short=TyrRS [Candidatus Blochmannia floridanus]CAD83437.1 tyrosyl-tRNA synthetase [Candidatus Blochmannia floridanus]
MIDNIIDYLYERGSIAQITDRKKLNAVLNSQPITLYCGFDPTADSLHIGHLAPLLCLKRFQKAGHRPLILLGGATGLIGDPSFKDSERKLQSFNTTQKWIKKIKLQIALFIDCNSNNASQAHIIDNYSWFSSMNILTFLRDIGKFFSINKMINKDIIKKRLKNDNYGISYTEFSYNLMQSYDFAHIYKHYDAILQIGGSDQWGNIISGIDLIKRMYKKNAYGLTVPLLTNFNNIKFGKTEKNTIWLDPEKTSPYQFYQYWINIDDKSAYHFLKIFTDISVQDINSFKNRDHSYSQAQYILAENMTQLVHGKRGLNIAQRISQNLFSYNILKLTLNDFHQLIQDGIPNIILETNTSLQEALTKSKLATSRSQARYFIKSNAITINAHKQSKIEYIFQDSDRIYNLYTLLKRGKKNYCLIQWNI